MHRLKAKSAKKYILNNNYHNNLRYRKIITRFYANQLKVKRKYFSKMLRKISNIHIKYKCLSKYRHYIIDTLR